MLLNAFRRLLSSSGSDTASRHSLLSDTPVWVDSLPRLLQLRGGKFERVRICTSHGAATIGATALLVSKVAARFVRPRCLVYCLPIPAPLISQIASVFCNHEASPPVKRLLLVPPPASSKLGRRILLNLFMGRKPPGLLSVEFSDVLWYNFLRNEVRKWSIRTSFVFTQTANRGL